MNHTICLVPGGCEVL